MSKPMTKETYVNRCVKKFGNNIDYKDMIYVNIRTPITIYCNRHEQYFTQNVRRHYTSLSGCPLCSHHSPTSLEFIEKCIFINGNRYNYKNTIYKRWDIKVEVFCEDCQKSFWVLPGNHLAGHGCPDCDISTGEYNVREILRKFSIKYDPYFTKHSCRNKNHLSFDFAIFNEETFIGAIEYQGKQHFVHVNFSGKFTEEFMQDRLEKYQENDKIKKEWCEKNNIPLLCLLYNEDEDLEKNVINFLKNDLVFVLSEDC
jgi:Zn finger protein HypA/HybF involved in hydrogenase expression